MSKKLGEKLRTEVAARAKIGWPGADFFAKHGTVFKGAKYPKRMMRGKPKLCFMNAYDLSDELFLDYVEGYATQPGLNIPFEHAWCVDAHGKVFDPTWPAPETCGYLGVIIPASKVRREINRLGHYGVIFTWRGTNRELIEELTKELEGQ